MRSCDFPRSDGAAGARDGDVGQPAGIEREHVVRPQRFDHAPAGTLPVSPRSGARKTAILAAEPAFSTRSPMRTTSAATRISERSTGAVCAAAAAVDASTNAQARSRTHDGYSSAHQVGGCRQHLVGCRDDLGVHLVGALCGDQIGDLADRFDIGLLKRTLLQVAVPLTVGLSVLRGPRSGRFQIEIVADALQAGLVDEQGQLDLPDLGRRDLARLARRHLALQR